MWENKSNVLVAIKLLPWSLNIDWNAHNNTLNYQLTAILLPRY